ncbi:hypothetical protein Tco_0781277 [Tanacetum coccineum]
MSDTNILKKSSEKHSIGKCHIGALGHTCHSFGNVVGKIKGFSNGKTVDHVPETSIGMVLVYPEAYGVLTKDDFLFFEIGFKFGYDHLEGVEATFKDFDNGLHSELNEVKTVFIQMEAAVEQCLIDNKYFDIQKKELSLDNDRLLDHIIYQDVMNIVMHVDYVHVNLLSADNKCLVNDNLKIKRLEQKNDHLFELLLSQDIV